jgi:hypothetical protein
MILEHCFLIHIKSGKPKALPLLPDVFPRKGL